MLKNKILVNSILIIVLTVFISGCAGKANFSKSLNNMLGSGKDTIVQRFGLPLNNMNIDSNTEIWEYKLGKKDYTSNTGYQYSVYTLLRITFKNNKMYSYYSKDIVQ